MYDMVPVVLLVVSSNEVVGLKTGLYRGIVRVTLSSFKTVKDLDVNAMQEIRVKMRKLVGSPSGELVGTEVAGDLFMSARFWLRFQSVIREKIGTHTIDCAALRRRNREGGGGGRAGPFTLWSARASRGRVAEWPVTDPILRYRY
jgi:hypothetical protein